MDAQGVGRAALIASVPGDEASVGTAVARHPDRFVGFFMLDPSADDAVERARNAMETMGLQVLCLFPAMNQVPLHDSRVQQVVEVAAARAGTAVFVHCGVLSVGVRRKLGLPSRFDLRLGDPLGVARLAMAYPNLPFIVPHFGAGLFREALMAADTAPNIHLDTSSSNSWIKYTPGPDARRGVQDRRVCRGTSPAAVRYRFVLLSPRVAARRLRVPEGSARDRRPVRGGRSPDRRRQFRSAVSSTGRLKAALDVHGAGFVRGTV